MFNAQWKVSQIRVLRSDNAKEFTSAEVRQIAIDLQIMLQLSNEYQQVQNGKAEKCIGDCWSMTRTSLLWSCVPLQLWERAFKNAGRIKRYLPCAANPDFMSPLQAVARGEKQPMPEKEFPPFGCLLFARVHPDVIKDTKFDPRAVPCAFIGTGELEGRKCMLGYTIDFSNKGRMGKIIHTVEYWVDPTFFPFRKAGDKRVTSLSS